MRHVFEIFILSFLLVLGLSELRVTNNTSLYLHVQRATGPPVLSYCFSPLTLGCNHRLSSSFITTSQPPACGACVFGDVYRFPHAFMKYVLLRHTDNQVLRKAGSPVFNLKIYCRFSPLTDSNRLVFFYLSQSFFTFDLSDSAIIQTSFLSNLPMPPNAPSNDTLHDASSEPSASHAQSVDSEPPGGALAVTLSSDTSAQRNTRHSLSSAHLVSQLLNRFLLVYRIMMITVSIVFLVKNNWTEHAHRLGVWLIVNMVLITARQTGKIGMRYFPTDRWTVLRIFITWIFRVIYLSFVSWFFVGIAFLRQSGNHKNEESGDIHTLVTVIIGIELVLLTFSIVFNLLLFVFALRPVLSGRQNAQGATKEELSKLSSFRFVNDSCEVQTCSVCLCEYQEDELLRELPCTGSKHIFHAACIDEWLLQKSSCPICREDPINPKRNVTQSTRSSDFGTSVVSAV